MDTPKSKKKRRRLWTHRYRPPTRGLIHEVCNTCAICRCSFSDKCIDHQDESPTCRQEAIEKSKSLWVILMMMHSRPESLFSTLDLHILSQIYRYLLPKISEMIPRNCLVQTLYCGHIYHWCCIQKWVAKRPVCPLCNSPYILSEHQIFNSMVEFTPAYVELDQIYDSDRPFVPQYLYRERCFAARNWTSNYLKHRPVKILSGSNESALSDVEIYQLFIDDIGLATSKYWSHEADMEISFAQFQRDVLGELLRLKYISCENGLYKYNP